MLVIGPGVVGSVVVVVLMEVMGRVGRSSLLLTESLSMKSLFEPPCAIVSQVVSIVRSFLSLLILVDCKYALMTSSHFLAGLPCFLYLFCLVDIAGFQLEMSIVQRSSWCLAIIFAC